MKYVQREGQTIGIPSGWVEASRDELVRPGDRFFNLYSRKFVPVKDDDLNAPVEEFTCIVRKEKS